MDDANLKRETRIGVRLNREEMEKVRAIARFSGCNFSEAVRRVIQATRVEPAIIVATSEPTVSDRSPLTV